MNAAVASQKRVWTEAELQALPNDGYIRELVDGELVMSPKNNFEHENLCSRVFLELASFARTHRLGAVLGSNLGCWMNNRNCRAPDISFILKARLERLGFRPSTRQFLSGAPDLAVEVVSRSNSSAEIAARLKDFFASGCQLAWLIHPEEQFVEVCHSPTDRTILGPGAELDGESILPGFRYPVASLFKDWEWE